jgi:SulP family sulfate permease
LLQVSHPLARRVLVLKRKIEPQMNGSTPANHPPWWVRLVPALGWLRTYQPGWLRADLVAGVTLAAYLIPSGIGDATLAGLPPAAGIYACIFSGLVFWLFTSARQTSVTVTSAISLLVGTSLAPLAGGSPAHYAALAAGTALLVAAIALLAWAVRAGSIVNFISETVLVGFKSGVALYLASTQLPKLCGFTGSHGGFWESSSHFCRHAGETQPASLAIGAGALAVLALGKRFLPNKPVGLVVVAASLLLGATVDLAAYGVAILGEVPRGLPAFGVHGLEWSDINILLPLALACFLLGAVETAAIGRMFARTHGYRLDSDQEFLALAGANLAAGLGHGYPTSGGMSQSLVNEEAGARTPLSGLAAAVMMLLVTVYLSGLLRFLPQPVLAAIVLVAVAGLFKLSALTRIWRFSRGEFTVAVAALLGVLCSGLLMGVLIGAIISLLLLTRRGMFPHTTELGQVPRSDYFADVLRHPTNRRIPDVFIFRCDGAVLYFNAEFVRDRFFRLLDARGVETKLAVFFLGTVPSLDLAGVELLTDIRAALGARGIDFRLAEAHGGVRETLRRADFEKEYGPIEPDQTVTTVLHRWGIEVVE